MGIEASQLRRDLQNEGADRASERRSYGLIGKVVDYHPNTGTKKQVVFVGAVDIREKR